MNSSLRLSPVLAYLRSAHHTWLAGQETFGDGRSTAIVRLVVIGHLEHRPYDYTSLSEVAGMSRQQVMRRCVRLGKAGWVINQREVESRGYGYAARVIVLPTEALLAYWTEHVHAAGGVLSRWVKAAALVGIVAVSGAVAPPESVRDMIESVSVAAAGVREVRVEVGMPTDAIGRP